MKEQDLTLRNAISYKTVKTPKTHHSYSMIAQTAKDIYTRSPLGLLDYKLKDLIAIEYLTRETYGQEIPVSEQLDVLLLEALYPPYHYPIFTLEENLYDKLQKTKCDIKSVVIDKPFAKCGVILLPKTSKYSVFVFKINTYIEQPKKEILSVLFISDTIGARGVMTLHLDHELKAIVNKKYEEIQVDDELCSIEQLLSNIFLYKQSVQDDEEVVYHEPRVVKQGFGKNTKEHIVPIEICNKLKTKTLDNGVEKGTHASPRTHWRCGHWRQHPIGSRKEPSYKTIWIEPVLVNL